MDLPKLYCIRESGTPSYIGNTYDEFPYLFSIVLHHEGRFSGFPIRKYLHGKIHEVDFLNIDDFTREDMYNIMKKISDATGVVENIESNEYFCYFQKPNCDLNVGLQQLWTEEDYMDLYMYIGHGKTQFLHIYIVKEEINEECEACRASSNTSAQFLGWISFSKRPGKNTPQCYTKPLDLLKNWNNRFFWVDEMVFPTTVAWQTSAPKDSMPLEGTYSVEDVAILNAHRNPIQKQLETLLCLVGLSRRYFLGDDVYLIFLYEAGREMDLFNQMSDPNPIVIKTGTRPRTAHEVPLLTVIAS
ncbi:hypothetical protein Tco_0030926 [Tanacetum coccineum]